MIVLSIWQRGQQHHHVTPGLRNFDGDPRKEVENSVIDMDLNSYKITKSLVK